jgi:hypothetical protein
MQSVKPEGQPARNSPFRIFVYSFIMLGQGMNIAPQTQFDHWKTQAASRTNLRLLIPGKGWVLYADRLGEENKVEERGSRDEIESALTNALSASNFLTLTGAGASFCARILTDSLRLHPWLPCGTQ